MSNFVDNTLTDAGAALLSEVLLGAKLQPTKIVMGSGFIPSGQTSKTLTNVVTPEVTLAITKKVRVDATHVEVGGVYNNQDITEAFYFRELALYCKAVKDDGTVLPEIMYSYGNAGNSADLMVPYTSGAAIEKQIDLITYVGNDTNVDLTISSGTYITMADLQDALKDLKAGSGIPPNDMQALTAASTESGINLTFTGPKNSYLYGAAAADTLACVPAGVMIRYKEGGYPEDIEDGALVGDFSINPVAPESTEKEVIGLTFGNTYYFTAFPYSTEGIYNKSQADANHAMALWSGNKGTINVNVQAYEGYEGVIGDYTITLVDQAADNPQNVEQAANGPGITQIGNLEAGKTYVVTLSDTSTLMADPSEPITIVAGTSYNVDMTYRRKYGTISVNVSTSSDFAELGEYTITLVHQEDGYEDVVKTATGKGVTVFDSLVDGRKYKVRLGNTPNFLPPADSSVFTIVGGENIDVSMTYAPGVGNVTINVSAQPAAFDIGAVTISLVPIAGGSTLTQQRTGSGTLTFNNIPVGAYTVTGSNVDHFSFNGGGNLEISGGQDTTRNVTYRFNATLNSLTWEEIDNYGQMGVAEELFSVGDTKDDVVSGETLTFEIVGFNHDPLADNSGHANITFGMKNCMSETRKMGGGPQHYWEGVNYENSDVFPWLEELYNGLQADMKNAIKTVSKKVIQDGDHENSIKSYNVHLFLFSGVEVFGPNNLSTNGNVHASPLEGTQYSRFVNSASRTKKLANGTGAKTIWSLRSPEVGSLNSYCYVTTTGSLDGGNDAYGICFGFCI